MRIDNHDTETLTAGGFETGADFGGGTVGVGGEEENPIFFGQTSEVFRDFGSLWWSDIGVVNSGVSTNETKPMFDDDRPRANAQYFAALLKDEFYQARIFVAACSQPESFFRGLYFR